ncbi:hypothetical protein BJV82DRAFT_127849 [Fennellomyces sp. T-0311]|nr:hypothetical protein BJV82DRAFT_127849 [Fennellomyces sp. T-0311]
MPGLTHKSDVALKLNIDPSFTGILRGVDNGVAERTYLKGTLIVCVYKAIKVRKLSICFEGRCKVTISTSNGTLASAPEGVECRNLITKKTRFISSEQQLKVLDKGDYSYTFEYELPPQLPASFMGKRGLIQYRLRASLHRSVFTNNVYAYRDITIRRSLMYDAIPLDLTETIVGRDYPEKIEYSACAPSVVYREGGLVPLNLNVRLLSDEHENTIRAITCALRERIIYQTTGQQSLTCKSISQTDESFPLGWSTFYPSEEEHFNPREKHEYNAQFRLCPRVHPDIKTRLVRVSHALIINIKVTEQQENSSGDENDGGGSTPSLSRSSSASSLSSIFSLGRQQASNTEELVKDALLTLSSGGAKRHHHHHHPQRTSDSNVYICSLEVPLVVTSRQHSWEGAMPHPPAYENAEMPPTYRQSIEHLPPAPTYRH